MVSIGVFFDAPDFDGYPFNHEIYRVSYADLARAMAVRGATLTIVRGQATYAGGQRFTGGWAWDGTAFARRDGEIAVTLLWNKGNIVVDDGCRIVNPPELCELCTDKWATYQTFPGLHARSAFARSADDLPKALDALHGDRVVSKPLRGEGGSGIVGGDRATVMAQTTSFPCIVQEFIDMSCGIPGLAEGPHDLRIISCSGIPVASTIRTPAPGKFTANVSGGGTERLIPLDRIPAETMQAFREIDAALAPRFPLRFYSTDFGRDCSGTWRIIELNSRPGTPIPADSAPYRECIEAIAAFFAESAKAL